MSTLSSLIVLISVFLPEITTWSLGLTQLYWIPQSQMYVWGRAGPFPVLAAPAPALVTVAPIPASPAAPVLPSSGQCGRRMLNDATRRRPKIVGGNEVAYGAYPWQVEIASYNVDNGSWKHHCGGSILGPELVVTAAHCLQPPVQREKLRIIGGDHNLQTVDTYEQIMLVADVLVHPDFRKEGHYSNDIAIIKVRSRTGRTGGFQFTTHVQPLCLPEQDAGPPPGTNCDVSGWGAQNADDMESLSNGLSAISVPLLASSVCRSDDLYGGRQQSILDSMICAGHLDGGRDACGGDSGGPLACYWRGAYHLTGLVSWGDGCAKKNRPGVYTRIDYYVDWIRQASGTMHSNLGVV